MNLDYDNIPLSKLLRERDIFDIFDEEFRSEGWLDVTALIGSDSSLKDLESDQTVPATVLERIRARLNALSDNEEKEE